jgi:hypothetical protein
MKLGLSPPKKVYLTTVIKKELLLNVLITMIIN